MGRYLTFPQGFVGLLGGVLGLALSNVVGGGNYAVVAAGTILGFGVGAGVVYMLGGGPGGDEPV